MARKIVLIFHSTVFVLYSIETAEEYYHYSMAHWNYMTNLTDYNSNITVVWDTRMSNYSQEKAAIAKEFNVEEIQDEGIKRQLKKISKVGIVLDNEDQAEFSEVKNSMMGTYGKAMVCSSKQDMKMKNCSKELTLTEITEIMETERDYDVLEHLWEGWRDASGKQIREDYKKYVKLSNKGARAGGFQGTADLWKRNQYKL